MHSSTSSSRDVAGGAPFGFVLGGRSARSGIIALLTGLVLIFLTLEVTSPLVLAHFSHTEQRVDRELQEAASLRAVTADGRPTILLAGNSLLKEGVLIPSLHDDLATQYEVRRLVIEQTHYLDWYFGLRRLLEEGSRPGIVVLTLATAQLASPLTLGQSFAHRQMSFRDFPRAVRESRLDRTTASTYLFAHWSRWLGNEGFIRQCVSISVFPGFRQLAGRIADHGAHIHDPSTLLNMAQQRQPELRDLSQQFGVPVVLLIPPNLNQDSSRESQELGNQIGVPVWILSPAGEFPRDYFSDGFHLNRRGAEIYTTRLSRQVRSMNMGQVARHFVHEPPNGKPADVQATLQDGSQRESADAERKQPHAHAARGNPGPRSRTSINTVR